MGTDEGAQLDGAYPEQEHSNDAGSHARRIAESRLWRAQCQVDRLTDSVDQLNEELHSAEAAARMVAMSGSDGSVELKQKVVIAAAASQTAQQELDEWTREEKQSLEALSSFYGPEDLAAIQALIDYYYARFDDDSMTDDVMSWFSNGWRILWELK